MESIRETQQMDRAERWPSLPYEAWKDTYETLHMWTQIVGKVRMELFFSPEMGEFLLRYEDVRTASSPEQALIEFFQSTYEAGATLGHWDREALERKAI